MKRNSSILILGVLLLALPACKGGLPDELAGLADERSLERLEMLPRDSRLLISVAGADGLGRLPELRDMGHLVGGFGNVMLVEVDRRRAIDLAEIPGVSTMVLWGDEKALERLDPMLRSEWLSAMALPDWQGAEREVIAGFAANDETIPLILSEYGLKVSDRRVRAGTVTLKAPLETLLDLANDTRLEEIRKPSLQRALQGR